MRRRSPTRVRSKRRVSGRVVPGDTRALGPTRTVANGEGQRLPIEMSATASSTPATTRPPMRTGQTHRRTRFGCGSVDAPAWSLTGGAPGCGRFESDQDGQVVSRDRGQSDERGQEQDVNARHARQWPRAGAPAGQALQVVEDARCDRGESV